MPLSCTSSPVCCEARGRRTCPIAYIFGQRGERRRHRCMRPLPSGRAGIPACYLTPIRRGGLAKKKIDELVLGNWPKSKKPGSVCLCLGKLQASKKTDAAIEEIFDNHFYIACVNAAFGIAIKEEDLPVTGFGYDHQAGQVAAGTALWSQGTRQARSDGRNPAPLLNCWENMCPTCQKVQSPKPRSYSTLSTVRLVMRRAEIISTLNAPLPRLRDSHI